MPQERWIKLEQVFADALELPQAARSAFLARRCGSDLELRREIDELLRSHAASGVLDHAPQPTPSRAPEPSLAAGACLGAWRIERLIGRGGMGEVYAATRIDAAFEQRAALKLLRYEAVGELVRFHAERRILARLEHPGIARLLDGGTAADGRPYTVMEYVDGRTLTDYCRARHADLQLRLSLFMQVCDAVAFAHRNLVIHRDLKPDNILVDAAGVVKLLDFGIAKLLDASAAAANADHTMAPFTPDYAAPEQLSGQPVTTATDTYALGVLLFELLTGERLVRSGGLPSTRARKLLLDRSAPTPSVIAQAQANPPVPARLLRGDLDAIVAKCLRQEAAQRYETVNGLKHDLERHLRKEPVLARSGARAYVARRFVRRHWLPMGAVLVLILGLSAAALYANAARLRTEQALHRADAVRDFVIDLFRQNDPEAGNSRTMSACELVDLGAHRVESGFGGDADTRIELLGVSGNLYRSLGEYQRSAELLARRLEQATQAYAPADPRRIEAQLDMAGAEIGAERFDAAYALLEQALASAVPQRVELLALRARILLELGRLESERDHLQQAIDWAQQAIDLQQRLPQTGAAQLAEALSDRGLYSFRAGRIADAEQPLRAALEQLDPQARDSFGILLSVRERLGRVLTSLGRFDEALPLLSANADAIRELLGDQHPLLANALHQLASATRQSGDSASAIPLFEHALALYEHNHGPDHSFVATALTGLGQSLSADGQYPQALAALTRAHDIYVRTLGPAHTYTAISTIAVADVQLKAGNLAAAEAGFRAALTAFAQIGDGKHIYAEAARLGLGKTLSGAQRCGEAEAPLRQAQARFVAEFGADDRRAIDAAAMLVHCLMRGGRFQEARQMLEESEAALAASDHDVSRERERLAAARKELEDGG